MFEAKDLTSHVLLCVFNNNGMLEFEKLLLKSVICLKYIIIK